MNIFAAPSAAQALTSLQGMACRCEQLEKQNGKGTDPDDALLEQIESTFQLVSDLSLGVKRNTNGSVRFECGSAAISAKYYIDREGDVTTIKSSLLTVINVLIKDLIRHKFLVVAQNKSQYVDNPNIFDSEDVKVSAYFPEASADIMNAGNCLAAECNTAAVFHLMRAVEWALRAFCRDVGLNKLFKELDKTTGKKVYIPIGHGTWDKILGQLHGAIKTRVGQFKRSRDKQKAQEFYHGAHEEFEAFKEAFRNHVMHTRRDYTAPDADAIRSHVKRFMSMLAARWK